MSKSKKKDKKTPNPVLLDIGPKIEYDTLTSNQKDAVKLFYDWYNTKNKSKKPVLRIGGYAGSGKSFMLRYILEQLNYEDNECYVVAYTGQAVNVLRQSGIMAKTIHSTFLRAVEEVMKDKNGNEIFRSGIPVMTTKYIPVKKIPSTIKLVICDEASFLPKRLEELILSYNVPLLELGDPMQLPPVAGEQCFHMENVDIFLTQIMRQSKDSEIIQLATAIRNYDPIKLSDFGNEVKFLWAQENEETTFARFKPFFRGADTIISCTNKQRDIYTELYRKQIIKTNSPFPIKGERLVCRKNEWNSSLGQFPLTNGTQGFAMHTVGKSDVSYPMDLYTLDFRPDFIENDYYEGLLCDAGFLKREFGKKNNDLKHYELINPGKKFEYAHVVTAHISQGGGYPTVLFLDAFGGSAEYHMRLRYTAVTRAKQKLYYMLPYVKNHPGWTDLTMGGFKD